MITTKSKINFSNLSVPPIIPVVQGDTGRVIQFELNDFTIPADATATYYVQKPSGEAVYNEATISGENVLVELTAQSIIEVGENYGQVRILVDEEVVTSFDFILLVKVFRGIEAVQSETEMNIFDKAVERAQETIASTVTEAETAIEAAAQEAEEYIAQAIDPTLTITDKAADAKVTGDGLKGIAAAFSTSKQYFAGDYVLHDFKLYRRVADCTSVWGDGSWIAANWVEANLGTDINQRVRIAASKYDHTKDYAVGEYCTHGQYLYRCISPVTGGSTGDIGNWDATKWEAVRIGEELTDLKEALTSAEATLTHKADKDGSYEDLTAGNAKQLESTQYVEDSEPYLFRTSGGSSDIGNREYVDAIVGGSVVWNQLIRGGNFEDSTYWNIGGSVTISNGTITVISGNPQLRQSAPIEAGHKYLLNMDIKPGQSTTVTRVDIGSGSVIYGALEAGSWRNFKILFTRGTSSSSNNIYFSPDYNHASAGDTYEVKNFQLIDLTQMFGSTIADYIYSLEQANAGTGVAWFKKLFPKDYYEYNAGTLKSVEGLASHDMVGFNQWDEEWELGAIAGDTGAAYNSTTRIRAKNYIPVVGGDTYYFKMPGVFTLCWYDADKNYISGIQSASANYARLAPDNAMYLRFSLNGTTYNHDICINLSWSGTHNGEYQPYEKHSYPLDDSLILRGIPKLDAENNLYYDGDRYLPDGTVTRKYGIVDLGTLDYTYGTSGGINYFTTTISGKKSGNNILSTRFATKVTGTSVASLTDDKMIIGHPTSGRTDIYIRDDSYSDKDTFKTAMSGVYLLYEIETPTTETADPYQEVQICNDWGTEEYVLSDTAFPVPVGHETRYPANLRDKLQHLPDLADDDGYYAIKQVGTQMSLELFRIPKAPTTPDGTYTLKATVTAQGVTYSWVAE